ncbi:MAG: response regulator [Gemmatimonadota bacterium]
MAGPKRGHRERLRVLIVEHDEADAEICVHVLQDSGFEVEAEVAGTFEELREAIGGKSFDVLLSDFRLPGWNGMEAFREIRSWGVTTPFILVTGTLGDEQAVECIKQGVADYVAKDHMARLPLAVRRVLAEDRARRYQEHTSEQIRVLTLALDQSPAAVFITDLAGRIQWVNRRFAESSGFTAEEAIGRTPRLLRSGEVPPGVYDDLWKSALAGHPWRGEIRNRRKSGELYWDSTTITPIRDTSGRVTHFLATQEDVTARKEAVKALEESEARFRKLIEATFDAVVITEAGVIIAANEGLATLVGRPLSELIGQPALDLVDVADRPASATRLSDGFEGRTEFSVTLADGRRLLLEATARLHEFEGRQVRISAYRDISGVRLLEDQLRQAQKMEAVGRLAGGVAHDFNNLLTVIASYADLLMEDLGSSDPRHQDLEQIRKAADGAASLTRQLLAFSRQQVIEPRVVTLEEVVGGAEKLLRRVVGEDVEFVTLMNPGGTSVLIDPGQLEQVIMNLAVNSRDAMPKGGSITIETRRVELSNDDVGNRNPVTPGWYGLLSVSDTGVGMDAATQERIFEPFFTTKAVGKGTGLGLATVYGIVKQNAGFIWVYSEPDRGAAFKIYLPLAGEVDEEHGAPAMAPPPEGRGETILLVEDAPGVREVARQILARLGYEVMEAPNGVVALSIAQRRKKPIHLLLTDVVMPEMSGPELAKRFEPLFPSARVLFMSGYTDDSVVRHGVIAPGVAYLQKPFSPATLARKVREILD